jgi:hypothetical protein
MCTVARSLRCFCIIVSHGRHASLENMSNLLLLLGCIYVFTISLLMLYDTDSLLLAGLLPRPRRWFLVTAIFCVRTLGLRVLTCRTSSSRIALFFLVIIPSAVSTVAASQASFPPRPPIPRFPYYKCCLALLVPLVVLCQRARQCQGCSA